MSRKHAVDLVIVGGGIAGLWLGNLLSKRGYRLLLLESEAIGAGQTLASQGMIHGGIKYSLDGTRSRATDAIAAMPARWREHLAGRGDVDLTNLRPVAKRYFLFAEDTAFDKLSSLLASKLLRDRVTKLGPNDYPAAFAQPGFKGPVYAVDDMVLDTEQLMAHLREPIAEHAYQAHIGCEHIQVNDDDVTLELGSTTIRAARLLLCAGAGNGPLLEKLGLVEPRMQLRPLHQVLVYHDYPHPLFAHCLTGVRGNEPRLTITTHDSSSGRVFYLGGAIAAAGVDMSIDALVEHARSELSHCLGWIDWSAARIETLRIDRAEPRQQGGRRPDNAWVHRTGPLLTCFPTKLSLVPDLGDRVLATLPPPAQLASPPPLTLPKAQLGTPPWSR